MSTTTSTKTKLNAYGGADAGMGAWKLYVEVGVPVKATQEIPNPAPHTETFHVEFLSQVAHDGVERASSSLGLKASKQTPLQIAYGGRSFYTGPRSHDFGRPIEALDYERLTGAPEMVALFYGALTRLGDKMSAKGIDLSDLELNLVVGLPHGSLKGEDGDRNKAAVRRWMEGEHHWLADKKPNCANVASVKIGTQATGALFDYLLDDTGKFIPDRKGGFKGEVGVISIGFNTVELQVVRQKEEVARFTAGATVGVRRLLEIVNGAGLYSLGELDSLLRTGQLDVSTALSTWEREVVGFIESKWGEQWKRFAAVLLVGGGVKLLENSLPYKFNGKAVIADQPVLAIARGLMKLGKMTGRKGRGDVSDPADG